MTVHYPGGVHWRSGTGSATSFASFWRVSALRSSDILVSAVLVITSKLYSVKFVLRLIGVLCSGSGEECLCAALAGLHPGDDGGGESRQLPVQRRRGPRSYPHLRQVGHPLIQSSVSVLIPGLEKTRVFFIKNQPSGFFGFFVFFWVFSVFWVFWRFLPRRVGFRFFF